MGAWADRMIERIRERTTLEFDAIGVEMVEDARESISVPVEYVGDGIVIRSDPGEPPRREHGHLWASTDHSVNPADGGDPQLTVFNDAAYARRLEYGDGKKLLPRPFFTPLKLRWLTRVGPRLLDAIYGNR